MLHSPPARRRFAAFTLTAALVLGVAGTAAGDVLRAQQLVDCSVRGVFDVTPEQRVAPGTSRIEPLRAADPDRDALPWTIRVSRSETGLQCSAIGQLKDETFGLVGLDGEFRALPEGNADACGTRNAARHPDLRRQALARRAHRPLRRRRPGTSNA